jgi:hypothetical protein
MVIGKLFSSFFSLSLSELIISPIHPIGSSSPSLSGSYVCHFPREHLGIIAINCLSD